MFLDLHPQYHIGKKNWNDILVNTNYFGSRLILKFLQLSQDISSPLGQFPGIIIMTTVINIILYLDEIIKFTFMHNYFIFIINYNFWKRVSCDLIQCVNYTRMYTLNFIPNVIGLINFTSNTRIVQLLSHSSVALWHWTCGHIQIMLTSTNNVENVIPVQLQLLV